MSTQIVFDCFEQNSGRDRRLWSQRRVAARKVTGCCPRCHSDYSGLWVVGHVTEDSYYDDAIACAGCGWEMTGGEVYLARMATWVGVHGRALRLYFSLRRLHHRDDPKRYVHIHIPEPKFDAAGELKRTRHRVWLRRLAPEAQVEWLNGEVIAGYEWHA